MTIYAPNDMRKLWRINYGIISHKYAQEAVDFWRRTGGVPSGCMMDLADAIEQIDADEVLLRKAAEALFDLIDEYQLRNDYDEHTDAANEVVKAIQERLK